MPADPVPSLDMPACTVPFMTKERINKKEEKMIRLEPRLGHTYFSIYPGSPALTVLTQVLPGNCLFRNTGKLEDGLNLRTLQNYMCEPRTIFTMGRSRKLRRRGGGGGT